MFNVRTESLGSAASSQSGHDEEACQDVEQNAFRGADGGEFHNSFVLLVLFRLKEPAATNLSAEAMETLIA